MIRDASNICAGACGALLACDQIAAALFFFGFAAALHLCAALEWK